MKLVPERIPLPSLPKAFPPARMNQARARLWKSHQCRSLTTNLQKKEPRQILRRKPPFPLRSSTDIQLAEFALPLPVFV